MKQTIGAVLREAAQALHMAGFDEAPRRARRLVAAALRLSPAEVFGYPERILGIPERERIANMLCRMIAHEPLSRIEGRREFWGLEFGLSADVLDPRPETEIVVEAVLAHFADRDRRLRLLDLGTGSGCLLLALLSEFRCSSGVGVDLRPGAIATARANAAHLGLAGRASFVVGDWGAAIGGQFEAIVANPPYIATAAIPQLPPEVREYDPRVALDGGSDGLVAHRAIAADLPRLLALDGLFAAEIGAGQSRGVAAILQDRGLAIDAVMSDLAGFPRCIVATKPAVQRAKKVGMACAVV